MENLSHEEIERSNEKLTAQKNIIQVGHLIYPTCSIMKQIGVVLAAAVMVIVEFM